MSLKGKMANAANTVLRSAGVEIQKKQRDFDSRLICADYVRRLHAALTASFEAWIEKQAVFEVCNRFDVESEVASFYEDFLRTPFRDQRNGSRFNNLLWLDLIAKAVQPSQIIDSGTFAGASAWALARGAPAADIFSFDLDLSRLRLKAPNVQYLQGDWMSHVVPRSHTANGLCYFDDHIDQARRLIEAHGRGFRYAIFDDDCSITSFPSMTPSSDVLPKVEFVLDPDLRDGDLIEWSYEGVTRRWLVDGAYLARARETIAATERLPNTSLTTGIHQTPYRIIRFARLGGRQETPTFTTLGDT